MVVIRVKNIDWAIGPWEPLNALFSTIASQLEPAGWGSRFPALMKQLFQGSLPASNVKNARAELATVAEELAKLHVKNAVWDAYDPAKAVPKTYQQRSKAKHLADFFIGDHDQNLVHTLAEALDYGLSHNEGVTIASDPLLAHHDAKTPR